MVHFAPDKPLLRKNQKKISETHPARWDGDGGRPPNPFSINKLAPYDLPFRGLTRKPKMLIISVLCTRIFAHFLRRNSLIFSVLARAKFGTDIVII